MHAILDALFRVLGGLGLLFCLTFVGKVFNSKNLRSHVFLFFGEDFLGFIVRHLRSINDLGYALLWHTALKHLPPVQEALGLRKPLKPPLESKREEIEALKQQHTRLMAPIIAKRNY